LNNHEFIQPSTSQSIEIAPSGDWLSDISILCFFCCLYIHVWI